MEKFGIVIFESFDDGKRGRIPTHKGLYYNTNTCNTWTAKMLERQAHLLPHFLHRLLRMSFAKAKELRKPMGFIPKNLFLWIGVVVGLPGAGYFLMSAVFYPWLNSVDAHAWPVVKAAWWSGGALALSVLFALYFGYSVFSLIKASNKRHGDM